jgi:hypothetical protein
MSPINHPARRRQPISSKARKLLAEQLALALLAALAANQQIALALYAVVAATAVRVPLVAQYGAALLVVGVAVDMEMAAGAEIPVMRVVAAVVVAQAAGAECGEMRMHPFSPLIRM